MKDGFGEKKLVILDSGGNYLYVKVLSGVDLGKLVHPSAHGPHSALVVAWMEFFHIAFFDG